MLPSTNRPTGAVPARPTDEFVPEVGREPRGRMQTGRIFLAAVIAPVVIATVPVSDSIRRVLYLGALALVWALIVRAVVRQPAERRWTGVAIGTGFMSARST